MGPPPRRGGLLHRAVDHLTPPTDRGAPPFAAVEPGPVRRDPADGAWVVTRWRDVTRALADPRLEPFGGHDDTIRRAVAATLHPGHLEAVVDRMGSAALRRAARLPIDVPVELMAQFVVPWAREVAMDVCGVPREGADPLHEAADRVFRAAARATGSPADDRCPEAAAELGRRLAGTADPQSFVALSGTLAALVGSAWTALVAHPDAWNRLRRTREGRDQAWNELLRYAGPARAVFRTARDPMELGGVDIGPGDRVTLVMDSANRDPDRFPDPHRLDLSRRNAHAHVALGRGAHGCPGATLVRRALGVATEALMGSADRVDAWGEAVAGGGFAIRTVTKLPVILRREGSPGGVEETTCSGR